VLSRRQARWAQTLSAYDFTISYQQGKANPADAPSRRPDYEPADGEQNIMLPTLQNKLRQAMAGGNAPLIRRLSMLLEQHWKNATPPEPIGPGRNEPLEPRGPTLVGHSVDPQHIRDVAADDQDEYDPQGLAWGTPRIAVANATKGKTPTGLRQRPWSP